MTEWYYAREGQQNGPVTFDQLVELARNGGLDPGKDSVWNASMQNWTPAGQVPGIFPAVSAPAAGASNPYAAPDSQWSGSVPAMALALTEIPHGSEQLDPMACVSRAYEIFKREFANILLIGLVYIACGVAVSMVFGLLEAIPTIIAAINNKAPEQPGAVAITLTIISRVIQQVASIYLQLGLARVGLNLVSGKPVSIGMIFGEGSKLLRAIGASILFGFAFIIGLVLLIVPGIYIALRFGQYMTAIVDRDLGIIEAFEYSSSLTSNNRMNLFLLGLLGMGIVIVGALLCLVGLVVAAPVVWLAALVAYRWMQYGSDAAKDHPGTQIPMLSGM